MYKTNKDFIDDACGKNNNVDIDKLTVQITREYGANVEVKFNQVLPTIMKDTDTFGIMKKDFDKWFTKI